MGNLPGDFLSWDEKRRKHEQEGKKTKTVERINVQPSMFNRAMDLNGNGLADLVLFYNNPPELRRTLRVIMNHGPW